MTSCITGRMYGEDEDAWYLDERTQQSAAAVCHEHDRQSKKIISRGGREGSEGEGEGSEGEYGMVTLYVAMSRGYV